MNGLGIVIAQILDLQLGSAFDCYHYLDGFYITFRSSVHLSLRKYVLFREKSSRHSFISFQIINKECLYN